MDAEATARLRERLRETTPAAFFDRGPGYPRLSGGLPHAEVDIV